MQHRVRGGDGAAEPSTHQDEVGRLAVRTSTLWEVTPLAVPEYEMVCLGLSWYEAKGYWLGLRLTTKISARCWRNIKVAALEGLKGSHGQKMRGQSERIGASRRWAAAQPTHVC